MSIGISTSNRIIKFQGITITINTINTVTFDNVINAKFVIWGNKKSVIAKSLENLVMIVPIGVLSNRVILALSSFHTIFEWSFCDELTQTAATIRHLKKLTITYKATEPMKR
mmetsp:Transcript_9478/g.9232  ORF Transcript_9478/g.9232 Transcript_9478/m.9232 type:complete len:112 (+) Transcript_9478:67-402(+)